MESGSEDPRMTNRFPFFVQLGSLTNFLQTAAEALYTDIDNLELHVGPLFP
jgi:hypothetical protein